MGEVSNTRLLAGVCNRKSAETAGIDRTHRVPLNHHLRMTEEPVFTSTPEFYTPWERCEGSIHSEVSYQHDKRQYPKDCQGRGRPKYRRAYLSVNSLAYRWP